MKKILLLVLFIPLICFGQNPDFQKYNNQINFLKDEIKYFKIEKINDQFYMLVEGGGNVGVFISDQDVVLVDNKTIIGLKNGFSYNEISVSIDETLNDNKTVKLNYIKSIDLEISTNY